MSSSDVALRDGATVSVRSTRPATPTGSPRSRRLVVAGELDSVPRRRRRSTRRAPTRGERRRARRHQRPDARDRGSRLLHAGRNGSRGGCVRRRRCPGGTRARHASAGTARRARGRVRHRDTDRAGPSGEPPHAAGLPRLRLSDRRHVGARRAPRPHALPARPRRAGALREPRPRCSRRRGTACARTGVDRDHRCFAPRRPRRRRRPAQPPRRRFRGRDLRSQTDIVLLYLESLGNPRRFAQIARRLTTSKPLIADKSGRSPAGRRAASSHTGALLDASEATFDALFEQAGVIRVQTLDEQLDVAAMFAAALRPRGERVPSSRTPEDPGSPAPTRARPRDCAWSRSQTRPVSDWPRSCRRRQPPAIPSTCSPLLRPRTSATPSSRSPPTLMSTPSSRSSSRRCRDACASPWSTRSARPPPGPVPTG
jgi:hypothetical protein